MLLCLRRWRVKSRLLQQGHKSDAQTSWLFACVLQSGIQTAGCRLARDPGAPRRSGARSSSRSRPGSGRMVRAVSAAGTVKTALYISLRPPASAPAADPQARSNRKQGITGTGGTGTTTTTTRSRSTSGEVTTGAWPRHRGRRPRSDTVRTGRSTPAARFLVRTRARLHWERAPTSPVAPCMLRAGSPARVGSFRNSSSQPAEAPRVGSFRREGVGAEPGPPPRVGSFGRSGGGGVPGSEASTSAAAGRVGSFRRVDDARGAPSLAVGSGEYGRPPPPMRVGSFGRSPSGSGVRAGSPVRGAEMGGGGRR